MQGPENVLKGLINLLKIFFCHGAFNFLIRQILAIFKIIFKFCEKFWILGFSRLKSGETSSSVRQ